MFHIKVSYTSSFSARFRSPTPPFARFRAHTLIHQPIAREPRLTSSILARFFLLYVSRQRPNQWQEVDGGKSLRVASWSWHREKQKAVTDQLVSMFRFSHKNSQQHKKRFFLCDRVKIVFVYVGLRVDCCVCMRVFWVWKSITRDREEEKKK
jgi:hypothetical protein